MIRLLLTVAHPPLFPSFLCPPPSAHRINAFSLPFPPCPAQTRPFSHPADMTMELDDEDGNEQSSAGNSSKDAVKDDGSSSKAKNKGNGKSEDKAAKKKRKSGGARVDLNRAVVAHTTVTSKPALALMLTLVPMPTSTPVSTSVASPTEWQRYRSKLGNRGHRRVVLLDSHDASGQEGQGRSRFSQATEAG